MTPHDLKFVKARMTPMTQKVLDHLLVAGSISNVEANAVHRCRSLSRRITELSKELELLAFRSPEKIPAIRKERRRDVTGQPFVRYHLDQ